MSLPPSAQVGHAPGAGVAPLGIYAKTSSAFPEFDQNGECAAPSSGAGSPDLRLFRAQRWALKSVVNRLLPTSRTSKCMRWRVPAQALKVMKSQEHGRAFYAGLQVCGSVWVCPVCAAKIAERRRAELVAATEKAKAEGLAVFLVTLTVPHGLGDDLADMLEKMQRAYKRLSSTRAGAALKSGLRVVGTVRAWEVTDGPNGFHPHFHVLLFSEVGFLPETVRERFSPLWQSACEAVGLPRPSDAHGCRVDSGREAAAYVSKWGLEDEMTKGHQKRSKSASGSSMWDLLRAFQAEGCKRSAARFRVYAEAFHGKRQLYWSNGLRARLGLTAELSDVEEAVRQVDQAFALAELDQDQWAAIIATRSEADVLDVAEKRPESLQAVVAGLVLLHGSMRRQGGEGSSARSDCTDVAPRADGEARAASFRAPRASPPARAFPGVSQIGLFAPSPPE